MKLFMWIIAYNITVSANFNLVVFYFDQKWCSLGEIYRMFKWFHKYLSAEQQFGHGTNKQTKMVA